MNLISPKTRMMGLPYGEEIVIVGRTMWTQSTSVIDRQTDGQTDRIRITNTVQRIASHGKNLSSSGNPSKNQISRRSAHPLRCYGHFCTSKMAVSRHLGFYQTANSAIRSADSENPGLEPNMEWSSGSDAPFARYSP